METYVISWRYNGYPYLLDVNPENLAAVICVALVELGRQKVGLSVEPYQEDEELKNRIWARVQQRLEEMPLGAKK